MSVSAVCAKLTTGMLLPGATVIIITRPEQSQQLMTVRDIRFDIAAEILGFTPAKVKEYITPFFKDNSEIKDTVLAHILGNENLLGFCYVPVNCFLTCSYLEWSNSSQNSELPTTVTEIYQRVLDMFIRRHHPEYRSKTIETKPEWSSDVTRMLNNLSEVALRFLHEKKYVFKKSDVSVCGLTEEDLLQLVNGGIVHCMPGCRTGPFMVESHYCFIHLTLQEFLAAQALLKGGRKEEIKQCNSGVVLQFVSGILRLTPPTEEPAELLNSIVNKIWNKKQLLLAIRCFFEYQDKHFARNFLMNNRVDSFDLSWKDVNASVSMALSFLLACDQSSITKLDLTGNKIGAVRAIQLEKSLSSGQCSLTKIDLTGNKIGDTGAEHLGKALSSANCSLEKLDLCGNEIGAVGTEHLGKALTSRKCSLKK